MRRRPRRSPLQAPTTTHLRSRSPPSRAPFPTSCPAAVRRSITVRHRIRSPARHRSRLSTLRGSRCIRVIWHRTGQCSAMSAPRPLATCAHPPHPPHPLRVAPAISNQVRRPHRHLPTSFRFGPLLLRMLLSFLSVPPVRPRTLLGSRLRPLLRSRSLRRLRSRLPLRSRSLRRLRSRLPLRSRSLRRLRSRLPLRSRSLRRLRSRHRPTLRLPPPHQRSCPSLPTSPSRSQPPCLLWRPLLRRHHRLPFRPHPASMLHRACRPVAPAAVPFRPCPPSVRSRPPPPGRSPPGRRRPTSRRSGLPRCALPRTSARANCSAAW
jgi:hypothetical protein